MTLFDHRCIFGCVVICLMLSTLTVHGATAEDYYNTGVSLYQKKQYPEAISYLKAAISLDPNHWRAFDVLALAEYAIQNYVDALDHCESRLALHPDNPPLAQLDKELKPKVYTPPLFPAAPPTPKGRLEGPPLNPVFWIKGAGLFDYSLEEDLNTAPNGWNTETATLGGGKITSSAGNIGFGFKGELGYQLDSEDAMSICFENFSSNSFQGKALFGLTQENITIQPSLNAFDLKFTHYWVHDNFRIDLNFGIGYYDGNFTYQAPTTAYLNPPYFNNLEEGNVQFDKGDFGAEVGGGYELRVDKDIGFELSGTFRYLSISEVAEGVMIGQTAATMGLVVYPNGFIGIANATTVNHSGVRWATFDFMGFQADLGLIYYIF